MSVYKTMRRESLLGFLRSHDSTPFTVRELAAKMSRNPDIKCVPSESTVYRLLRELEKEGKIIKSINPENREYTYRLADKNEPSVNMRCKVCGNVYSVDSETSRRIKEDIAGCADYGPDDNIELVVKCKKCKLHEGGGQNDGQEI